jgi:hypothetical protein
VDDPPSGNCFLGQGREYLGPLPLPHKFLHDDTSQARIETVIYVEKKRTTTSSTSVPSIT